MTTHQTYTAKARLLTAAFVFGAMLALLPAAQALASMSDRGTAQENDEPAPDPAPPTKPIGLDK